MNYCAERDRGYRSEHLVIGSSYPPLDLVSLLAPCIDSLEIREEVLGNRDIWNFGFVSRQMSHKSPSSV